MQEELEINLIICGEPFGKQRPRVIARGKGASRAFTPKKTVLYEEKVRLEYIKQYKGFKFGDKDELHLDVKAFYKIPKSKPKRVKDDMQKGLILPTKKPDVDNIIKIIADGLNKLAYKDDAQIAACSCQKMYSDNPHVEVNIRKIKKTKKELKDE